MACPVLLRSFQQLEFRSHINFPRMDFVVHFRTKGRRRKEEEEENHSFCIFFRRRGLFFFSPSFLPAASLGNEYHPPLLDSGLFCRTSVQRISPLFRTEEKEGVGMDGWGRGDVRERVRRHSAPRKKITKFTVPYIHRKITVTKNLLTAT